VRVKRRSRRKGITMYPTRYFFSRSQLVCVANLRSETYNSAQWSASDSSAATLWRRQKCRLSGESRDALLENIFLPAGQRSYKAHPWCAHPQQAGIHTRQLLDGNTTMSRPSRRSRHNSLSTVSTTSAGSGVNHPSILFRVLGHDGDCKK